jgi:leader peptidase (prepilin peptidase)/N-methyltransferase
VIIFFYLISISVVVIDIEEGIIPDELIFVGFVVTFFYLVFLKNNLVFQNLFFGFLLSLFMLSIHLITKGKGMGLGDVKFTLFPATLLSYPLNLIWLFLSFILGSVVGILLILFKKAKFGKPIPFGPFLALSFLIVLLWGENLVELIIPLFKY